MGRRSGLTPRVKQCRRLKPARDSYNLPTQGSTHPNSHQSGASWGPGHALG